MIEIDAGDGERPTFELELTLITTRALTALLMILADCSPARLSENANEASDWPDDHRR
jgi:hypothetical protein